MNNIICPVCGVTNAVKDLPWNSDGFASEDICPCCGTHYGEDDWAEDVVGRRVLWTELRKKWIDGGMKWWSQDTEFRPKPQNWDPHKQLENIPEEFI
jgi:RNA polymerase subunit RPABC4/transcription elongation factor Spt4